MIDLLLGGAGTASEDVRELTEIDEEIMKSVTALIVKQLEASWRDLNLSLTPARCVKPGMIQQIFLANEKLVLLMFEMTLGLQRTLQYRAADILCGIPVEEFEAAQSKRFRVFVWPGGQVFASGFSTVTLRWPRISRRCECSSRT